MINCIYTITPELTTSIFTAVLTVATIVLARYTYLLVDEARKTRKAQIQPYISIHLEHSEVDVTNWYVVIQNIGQGPAYNLKFTVEKDIDDLKGTIKLSRRGVFTEGMSYCPTAYKQKHFFMSTGVDYEQKRNVELIIKVEYLNTFKEKTSETFNLKYGENEGSGKIKPSDTYIGRIAENLEEIKKLIEKK